MVYIPHDIPVVRFPCVVRLGPLRSHQTDSLRHCHGSCTVLIGAALQGYPRDRRGDAYVYILSKSILRDPYLVVIHAAW
jgi:hypothetical protein